MTSPKNLLVAFPYRTCGNLHPWIKNEVWVFRKLGFKTIFIYLPEKRNIALTLLKFLFQIILLPIKVSQSEAILIPTSYLMLYPILLAKITGKKVYISHLSTMGDPSEKIKIPKFIKFFMRLSDMISFHLANYILTFSKSIADELCIHQRLTFNPKKIYCREVIDPGLFKPNRKIARSLKKKLNLNSNFILFYHGKFHPFHGMEYFFEAFRLMFNKNNNLRLVVLSFPIGGEKTVLKREIFSHPGIIFLPPVKYERLVDFLQIADLWVGRFKYDKEGDTAFSTCAVEAMACGKPIITYDNRENAKVIRDQKNGLLIPGQNVKSIVSKITPYLNQRAERALKEMGKNARKTAIAEFSNKNLANWLRDTYQ